jgi:hypothetical protein
LLRPISYGDHTQQTVPVRWNRREGMQPLFDVPLPPPITDASGYMEAFITAVGERGSVVGMWGGCNFEDCFSLRSYVWTKTEGFQEREDVQPQAINKRGVIAGVCRNGEYRSPCLYENGIQYLLDAEEGIATDVNDRKEAAGTLNPFTSDSVAMAWDRHGVPTQLWSGDATAINNRGIVVGTTSVGVESRVVAWVDEDAVSPPLSGPAIPTDINDRGWVIGRSLDGSWPGTAFAWNIHSGTLVHFGSSSLAVSINDRNDVLGLDSQGRVVIWHLRNK